MRSRFFWGAINLKRSRFFWCAIFVFTTTAGFSFCEEGPPPLVCGSCCSESHEPARHIGCCCGLPTECEIANAFKFDGVWFPESPPLFRPFVADPREVCYSIGWRFRDQVLSKNVIDVSFGDSLPIYRWCSVWPWGGEMQLEVEGAVWAVFAPCQETAPLINADYYCGIPVTYRIDNWSFRLRIYHISSHLGDEFLIDEWKCGNDFKRVNPSAEYIDFFASYEFGKDLRVYGGLGWAMHQDESFKCGSFIGACGLEARFWGFGYVDCRRALTGVPFLGVFFRFNSDFKHHVDSTYVLGYEWGRLWGLYRRLRIFAEYHDGYSLEGQFCKHPTNYFSLRASYGF